MTSKILVVEDNINARQLLIDSLSGSAFEVLTAGNGREALTQIEQIAPDLILLDVMMPTMDGYQFISRVRRTSDVPIIMLTAKRQEHDVIKGFELGADDYVTKPFRMRELLMRIRAVLRRHASEGNGATAVTTQQVGRLVIDKANKQATIDDKTVAFTPAEFCVLERLANSVNLPVSRQDLSAHLQQHSFSGAESTLKIHVRNIRQKIETDPRKPQLIGVVFGVGYRLQSHD